MRSLSVALLVGALAGGAVHGSRLRGLVEDDIRKTAKSYATGPFEGHGRALRDCRAEDSATEDRTCESNVPDEYLGQAARCTDCTQQCHIWGDPHLRPFDNVCTTNVWTEPGEYLFLDVPGLKIEAEVERRQSNIGNKPWVVKAVYNGDPILHADECTKDTPAFKRTLMLKSDSGEDVKVELHIGCRHAHSIYALEIWTTVVDQGIGGDASASSVRSASSSNALQFWKDARGVCVDIPKYRVSPPNEDTTAADREKIDWACQRESHLIEQQSPYQCTCSAECTAWGDPHINDFARQPGRSTRDSFTMPKQSTLSPAEHIVYTFQDRYAVAIFMDDCELIVETKVYIMKDSVLRQFRGCGTRDWFDSSILTLDDYDVFTFKADDVCAGNHDWQDRLRIDIPDVEHKEWASSYLDEEVGGYNLGRHAEINGLLYPLDWVTGASKCLRDRGIPGSDSPDAEVFMGAVKTVLKCHKTKGTSAVSPSGLYFNLCIYRSNMEVLNSKETSMTGLERVLHVEKAGRSGGWCATGDVLDAQASIASSSFEQRGAGESNKFAIVSDHAEM